VTADPRTVRAAPPGSPVDVPRLPPGQGDRKVLVIGVDGLRHDRIAGAHTPVLDGLAAAGLYGTGALDPRSRARTESGPGWSTIATGVGPRHHGVKRNSFKGQRYDEHPDFLTLATRARPGLSTFVAVNWPPLVEKGTFGPEISGRMVFDGSGGSITFEVAPQQAS